MIYHQFPNFYWTKETLEGFVYDWLGSNIPHGKALGQLILIVGTVNLTLHTFSLTARYIIEVCRNVKSSFSIITVF